MQIRILSHEDYDNILCGWWKDWGWQAPSRDFLPEKGTGGMIVFDDETPVCAGFMYATNSGVAWVDWIISDKDYRGESRQEAIELLVSSLTAVATASGYKFAYALIKHESLVETYKSLGYSQADQYTTEMIKTL